MEYIAKGETIDYLCARLRSKEYMEHVDIGYWFKISSYEPV